MRYAWLIAAMSRELQKAGKVPKTHTGQLIVGYQADGNPVLAQHADPLKGELLGYRKDGSPVHASDGSSARTQIAIPPSGAPALLATASGCQTTPRLHYVPFKINSSLPAARHVATARLQRRQGESTPKPMHASEREGHAPQQVATPQRACSTASAIAGAVSSMSPAPSIDNGVPASGPCL
jgi:hypothetical protein